MLDLSTLQLPKTLEEFAKLLQDDVAKGGTTQEAADALMEAYVANIDSTGNYLDDLPQPPAIEGPSADDEKFAILQQQKAFEEEARARMEAENAERPWWDKRMFSGTPSMSGASDNTLLELNNLAAQQELAERERIQNLSFIESLGDPAALARMGKAALKGPGQAVNALTVGLPALATAGAQYVTGADLGAEGMLQSFSDRNEELNTLAGVSDPLNPAESLGESLTGALIPGGALAKAGGVGLEFGADQIIRELIDEPNEKYETVFDQIGLTNNQQERTVSPLVAIAGSTVIGAMSGAAIKNMMLEKVEPVTIRELTDLDKTNPEKLSTVEKASDLTKAQWKDEHGALKDILARNGIADMDELDVRIDTDNPTAFKVRVQEAMTTGKLTTADGKFNSPVAPKILFDAYNALSPDVKTQVGKYINLLDYRDDLRILSNAGEIAFEGVDATDKAAMDAAKQAVSKATAAKAQLATVEKQLVGIYKNVPEAGEFSQRYNSVTRALRDYAQGSLFSEKYKLHLDKTRPNYVPLEISDVDPNAPLLQRMYQARTKESDTAANKEWFMQTRELGSYDMDRRADPMIMLMQATEATLNARGKNDLKLNIVDNLLKSEIGAKTMRKATKEEIGEHPNNIVEIYRNGEKEKYITSRLTADLMKFDPYIAKHPILFAAKRVFEQAAVGPLSVTFAPVTMIRDTIGGVVGKPQGVKMANPLEVAAAIPEQVVAKAQKSLSSYIDSTFMAGKVPIFKWIKSPEKQQEWSNKLAESYIRSIYHQANDVGGFDASLMKNKIELGKNSMSEIVREVQNMGSKVNIPGGRFAVNRIRNMAQGFTALFDSIQDAPRFATLKKSYKAGVSMEEAVAGAKQITGDVTRSGRVYRADGKMLEVDAVDQGLLNYANPLIGRGVEFTRESTPFFNPMIQGLDTVVKRFVENPIQTNLLAWGAVGMPSLVSFGWNEMLGPEYNDYAMNQRSSRDVAMNLYIANPFKPPEEGIEIPLPHEFLLWSSPYTRGLYGMLRGEEQEKTRGALGILSESILGNSLEVGFPVAGQAVANLAGVAAPESLIRPNEGVYMIKDDDLGVLPENINHLARTLFAGVGDIAINTANALSGTMDMDTFGEEVKNNLLRRTPVAKNIFGKKTSNHYFSIPNTMAKQRFEKVSEFMEYYNAFYEPKRFNDDGLQKPSSSGGYTKIKNGTEISEDLPFLMIGPEKLQEPVNPLYKAYGRLIVDGTRRGDRDMTAMISRMNNYNKYLKRLKSFNAGDKEALRDWHAMINGIVPEEEGTAQLKALIEENGIDLTKYDDRVKMINYISEKQDEIIQTQVDIFDQIEEAITADLIQKELLPQGKKFSFMKHLNPHNPRPLH